MVTSPLNTEYRQIFRVMDTITITGNELHAFAAKIAQIAKEELMKELKSAGMILSENEAREYKKYKAATEPLLKQSEAARLLGVSPQTVMRMRDSNLLQVVKLDNGSIRFKKSQILAIKSKAV
ncbi:MAG: helix-turn-helix domain-containing protein [Lachnospiraceae bacterium]|nr:helix-turn-helix domain-containing protein [Lachnospiraceae bacterium]